MQISRKQKKLCLLMSSSRFCYQMERKSTRGKIGTLDPRFSHVARSLGPGLSVTNLGVGVSEKPSKNSLFLIYSSQIAFALKFGFS